ncbi:MAG: hypothetical protein CM1200mP30_33450 [Pseudomonadota bacterium]|nr:MAG: hypothetical protein CM1200mP30_33450 [Pseudomonadota bacterium]
MKGNCLPGLQTRGHWPDTGGSVPGGFSANATEVEQEGLRLPPVKLYKAGEMDEEILSIVLSNIRIADQRIGTSRPRPLHSVQVKSVSLSSLTAMENKPLIPQYKS